MQISDLAVKLAQAKVVTTLPQRLPEVRTNGFYSRIGRVSTFTIPMGPGRQRRTLSFGTPNKPSKTIGDYSLLEQSFN